ncbi:HAD family hydrolase [Vibrio ulleungensis]|uniref:HAD family hydrolase n=1 Tax=Vibrio ulleungensis TaxID=2807619 RepID=A0ABS2HB00_9VIBR|nr:HAD family hydrolase [Vibrio ulleungensis]MBM7034790.1 HAD family hydrolase [Vibrio ulleungensis]
MRHYMFDIDGTLVQSHDMDETCFLDALYHVTGIQLTPDWSHFPYVTDRGILKTFIETHAPQHQLKDLERDVKNKFIENIRTAIEISPIKPVKGAVEFINALKNRQDVSISFATGGWLETALLKLESAGFDTTDIAIASSNDHYCRTEIMKTAALLATGCKNNPFVYFGDGEWDVKACAQLGVKLVLVGDRTQHHISIPDFNNQTSVLALAGDLGA